MRPLLAALVLLVTACGQPPREDAGGSLACGVAPLVFDAHGDVVQGELAGACARVERREVALEGGFICKACPYEPLRLIVHTPGLDLDVGADALTYEPSHHNWADTMTASVDGVTTRVQILYDLDGGWDLELSRDDDVLVLPVVGSR